MRNIEYCKKCKKRKFDSNRGIICSLTEEKPNFIDNCGDFEKDETVKVYQGQELRPNEKRSSALLLLIWLVLILECITLISSTLQYNLLQIANHGGEITTEAANANDFRVQVIAYIYVGIFIISGIAFLMWFQRAYHNLHQKVNKLSFREGWAAGSWFVPIINLYRPYQIMKELFEETINYISNKNNSSQVVLSTKLLGIWWTLWLLNGFWGRVIYQYSKNTSTISELIRSTIMDMIGSIIGIGLGYLTIKIIKDYSGIEKLL